MSRGAAAEWQQEASRQMRGSKNPLGMHARLEMSARLELSIATSAGAMSARLEMR